MRKALFVILIVVAVAAGYRIGRGRAATRATAAASTRRVLYWVDPMHPAYKSDKPGIAPDCGMQLEPVYADGPPAAATAPLPAGAVHLAAEQRALIGVSSVPVQSGPRTQKVRVFGRVAAEDTRVYRITSAVQGWVQETDHDSIGEHVAKDQKLATFYSPDFVTFVNGYLAAAERGTSEMKEFVRSVQYSADRLRALGMSELQIKEVAGNRKVPNNIYLVSPADGFILARNISPGMRFDRQTEFYQIADLSRVWVVAEIFENEAAYFHPGMTAKVTLPGRRQPITARVTNVLPQVDPATRTLRLRLEADNPGFALRPDMFVDVELPVAVPAGLMVPRDAVMDFGLKKRVFVDLGEGVYAPREVETGWQSGDLVQVVRGLAAGDRVVASGTFLLDSESRLRASASASAAPPPDNSAPMSVPMSKSLHSAMTTSTPGQATPLPASLPMDRPAAAGAKSSLPMMPAASKPAGRTARDPKCGMMVDVAEATAAGRTFAYKGTTYYFCSLQDKTDFSRDPERYLNHSAAMASPGMDGHD